MMIALSWIMLKNKKLKIIQFTRVANEQERQASMHLVELFYILISHVKFPSQLSKNIFVLQNLLTSGFTNVFLFFVYFVSVSLQCSSRPINSVLPKKMHTSIQILMCTATGTKKFVNVLENRKHKNVKSIYRIIVRLLKYFRARGRSRE